jgi:hypothetical protein
MQHKTYQSPMYIRFTVQVKTNIINLSQISDELSTIDFTEFFY